MYTLKYELTHRAKSVLRHFTRDTTTVIFILLTILHALSQSLVQSFLYSVDRNTVDVVQQVITHYDVPMNNLPLFHRKGSNATLQLCSDVPQSIVGDYGLIMLPNGTFVNSNASNDGCVVVFQTGETNYQSLSGYRRRDADDTLLDPTSSSNQQLHFSPQCQRVLLYPNQVLRNSMREEIALLFSEFWLLGMSVFAVMYNSIPGLLASVTTHALSVGWSIYSLWRTYDVNHRFNLLVYGTTGACTADNAGNILLGSWAQERISYQIADIALNVVSFLGSIVLTWRLVQNYSTYMFSHAGAPPHLMPVYRVYLALLTILQLCAFYVTTGVSLWIDQLLNDTAIHHVSRHLGVYKAFYIFALLIFLPWIFIGWYSTTREHTCLLFAFIGLSGVLFTVWCVMYDSAVYRYTWLEWPFFACMTVSAQVVVLLAVVLGIWCWRGFGSGLSHYLGLEKKLAKSGFVPEMFSLSEDAETQGRKSTGKHQHSNSTLSDMSITSMDKPPMDGHGINVSVVVSTTSDNSNTSSPLTLHTGTSPSTVTTTKTSNEVGNGTSTNAHTRQQSTSSTNTSSSIFSSSLSRDLTDAQKADLDAAEKWIQEVERRKVERRLEREAEERYLRGEDEIWVGPRRGRGGSGVEVEVGVSGDGEKSGSK